MIKFKSIVEQLLESSEDKSHGQRQGGLTGKSFEPRGHSKSSAIQGVGLYNRERESRYEYDPTNNPLGTEQPTGNKEGEVFRQTQTQAQAEMRQMEKKRFRQLSSIFGIINKDPELKSQAEEIIHEYMDNFRAAQAFKQRIGRNINSNYQAVLFKGPEPGTGSDHIDAPDLRPGESDMRRIELDKPSKHAKDVAMSEKYVEWIEAHDHIVYETFVDFAVEVVSPVLNRDRIELLKQKHAQERTKATADKQEFDQELNIDEQAELEKISTILRFLKDGTRMYHCIGIRNRKTKREGWINIFPDQWVGCSFESEEAARRHPNAKGAIATIKIEWEEYHED